MGVTGLVRLRRLGFNDTSVSILILFANMFSSLTPHRLGNFATARVGQAGIHEIVYMLPQY
jgi:hypothetical protein